MGKGVTKRILVIDNDPTSTRMVRLTLERHEGFQVCELNNPARAPTIAGMFKPHLVMTSLLSEGEAAGPRYSDGSRVLAKLVECVAGMLNTLCSPPAWDETLPGYFYGVKRT